MSRADSSQSSTRHGTRRGPKRKSKNSRRASEPQLVSRAGEKIWKDVLANPDASEAFNKLSRLGGVLRAPEVFDRSSRLGGVLRAPEAFNRLSRFGDVLRVLLLEMPLDPLPIVIGRRYAGLLEKKLPDKKRRDKVRRWANEILGWGYREFRMGAAQLLIGCENYEKQAPRRSYPAHVKIVELVKTCTGRYFYEELAVLLTAAHQARGHTSFYVTADGLKQAYKRNRERG